MEIMIHRAEHEWVKTRNQPNETTDEKLTRRKIEETIQEAHAETNAGSMRRISWSVFSFSSATCLTFNSISSSVLFVYFSRRFSRLSNTLTLQQPATVHTDPSSRQPLLFEALRSHAIFMQLDNHITWIVIV